MRRSKTGGVSGRFGRKLGMARYLWYDFLRSAGVYGSYSRINWTNVERLVFVCDGNICRSAYAEECARSMGIEATSVGLGTRGGDKTPTFMVEIAAEAGVDLTNHCSRPAELVLHSLRTSDLVLAMEPKHLTSLRGVLPAAVQRTLLGLWARDRRAHIEDPYGLSTNYIRTCVTVITDAVLEVVQRVTAKPTSQYSMSMISRGLTLDSPDLRTGLSISGDQTSPVIQETNAKTADWRHALPVLVTEAHTMGAIACIRSLGRAGYPVHACSQSPDALGLLSRFCKFATVCPDYDRPDFIEWLRHYVRENDIRAIIPSESFALAIRPVFGEFGHLLPSANREDIYYQGLSKFDVHTALINAGGQAAENLPPTLLLDAEDPESDVADFCKLGYPVFLKVDGSHARGAEIGKVVKAELAKDARDAFSDLKFSYKRVLAQGYVPGRGVGAFFLCWDEEIIAEFQHQRLHEVPHTGGVSSLRESFFHPGIRKDALIKIRALSWFGVGMLEYRLDPETNRFYFIEFNGRFWGSLHLALFSGVDFPTLLLDAFHGRVTISRSGRLGVKCRNTFPQELQHLWSRLKDRDLKRSEKLFSVLEFVVLSFDWRVRADLSFPGDRRLWWKSGTREMMTLISSAISKSLR